MTVVIGEKKYEEGLGTCQEIELYKDNGYRVKTEEGFTYSIAPKN